jgi:hypothetical protein
MSQTEQKVSSLRTYARCLEYDVMQLHQALDAITTLFVSEHGFDYGAVDKALLALKFYQLPVSSALAEEIEQRTKKKDAQTLS